MQGVHLGDKPNVFVVLIEESGKIRNFEFQIDPTNHKEDEEKYTLLFDDENMTKVSVA